MTTPKALEVLMDSLTRADELVKRVQSRAEAGTLDVVETALLARVLRSASCAANKLAQRAAGVPEPKLGD
jgi:hypothetical protein